jgi:hypothetical protein
MQWRASRHATGRASCPSAALDCATDARTAPARAMPLTFDAECAPARAPKSKVHDAPSSPRIIRPGFPDFVRSLVAHEPGLLIQKIVFVETRQKSGGGDIRDKRQGDIEAIRESRTTSPCLPLPLSFPSRLSAVAERPRLSRKRRRPAARRWPARESPAWPTRNRCRNSPS